MRLTSTGLGIGVSAPQSKLHIIQTAETIDDGIKIVGSSSPVSGRIYMNSTDIHIDNATAGQNTGITIDTSGNVGISEASPQTTLHVDGTGALFESMSIDTNLSNVTSSFSRQNTGFNYRTTEGLNVTTNSNASASLNRKSDGRILDFYKNDTRKGSISIGDNGISISLGGTGTANTLDDYEEGTWTPTAVSGLSSFSVSAANSRYVKIGSFVHVQAYVTGLTGKNSSHLLIGGLPYTVKSYSVGVISAGTNGHQGFIIPTSGSTQLEGYYTNATDSTRENLLGNDTDNYLIFSVGYYTDN